MFNEPTVFRAVAVPFTTLVILAATAFLSGCSAETDEPSSSNEAAIGVTQSDSAEAPFGSELTAGESTTRADVGGGEPRPSPKTEGVDVACEKLLERGAPCE